MVVGDILFTEWKKKKKKEDCGLENPRDGGAWWAAVYGVRQSRTRLKRHSSIIKLIVPKQDCLNTPKPQVFD